MAKSIKTNVILNTINTIVGIVYPVITFPYVARILQPEGVGLVNFYNSIISYIVLVTSLGIPLYAVREVGKYQNDADKRNKTTIEILLLSALLCVLGYVTVFLLANFVDRINTNISLFYILSLSVLFTSIGTQWFYQGIEDFKYITIRGIFVRTIAALCLFIFVKTEADILIYGLVFVGSTVGNNILNFLHLKKYIKFSSINWKNLDIFRHLRPALKIFVLNLIVSLYVSLNTVMLGFMDNYSAVGQFTAGNRITHIVLSLVTSASVVLLPRFSSLYKEGKMEEFSRIASKSITLLIGISLPCIGGIIILAEPITLLFCGSSFTPAIKVVYIIAPVILFISLTNALGIQILYPQGKENIVILSTIGGAIINIILNLLLIPRFSFIGVAISTCITELIVLLMQVVLGRKYYPFKVFDKGYCNYVMGTIVMFLIIAFVFYVCCITNPAIQCILGTLLGIVAYGLYLYVTKDQLINSVINYLKSKK